ncbi:hypothetical protein AMELA_G00163760 [Ameiurus melas]|uniref:Uncharacterized protein n=1 Tax=Ameiurus melas TaxID=219545 RepID=A0A7J6AIH2_AMEME|nr:hypothetical protein AMELA_G00163760 [Ameiurus melas]
MMINQRSPSSNFEGVLQNHLGLGGLFSGPHGNLAALEKNQGDTWTKWRRFIFTICATITTNRVRLDHHQMICLREGRGLMMSGK